MENGRYGVFADVLAAVEIGSWKIEIDPGREPRMYADATMMRLLGLEENAELAPEAVYHAWYDRVDIAHYDAVAEGVEHMVGGRQAEIQYPWHHPDGRTILVRCGGTRDNGYTAGVRVVGIHQWVTYMRHVDRELDRQKRQLEEALAQTRSANKKLTEQKNLLDYFVRSYSSAYSVDLADGTFEVLHMNHPFPDAIKTNGKREDMLNFISEHVHPDDRAMLLQLVDRESLTKRLREESYFNFTIREIFGDETRTMRGLIVRGVDEYHVALGFMDITDEIRFEEERQKQVRETMATERANQAKSYFFSMVSHDIRTPLNAIIGYAELLKLGIADEKERAKAVDSVLVSGHTLLELINDVLDLSKLEAGKMEILPEPVDITRLVSEVANAFRASIGRKPVEIRTDIEVMPWVKLDPHRVRQILFNLVGNAVKFTAEGQVLVKAGYQRGEDRHGTFRFEVSDTGCGISDEDQERIAQPYVQVGSSTNRGKGTGLGLAICKQLVARMGGEIELESVLGKGTTFTVILPGVEEEDSARMARLSATQRIRFAVKEAVKSYSRVLVVDDQPMNRTVLRTMLTRFGISDIDTAENGRSALRKLRSSEVPFDLVLADMWMPEMDGEALVREIRRNPAWAKLPVYAVTADVETQKSYTGMGFTGILLKPITLEKLKGILHRPGTSPS